MRTRLLFAVLGAPVLAMACAVGGTDIVGSGDGGSVGNPSDASYGADDATTGSDAGSTPIDSGGGGPKIDSGGGGPSAPLVTDAGDCIGDPAAPAGYDFQCEFNEAFGDDEPCTPEAGTCATNFCCFAMTTSQCYADYGPQCVQYQ